MKGPSAGKPTSKWADWLWWGTGIGSALVLFWFLTRDQQPDFDSDLCPTKNDPAARVVVLLDPSDSLHTVQQKSANDIVRSFVKDSIPARSEIRLYNVAGAGRAREGRVVEPELRRCVPSHVTGFERLSRNPEMENRKFEALLDRVDTLLAGRSDTVSPIVEAIQATSVDAFPPSTNSIPRHMFIVSDMVQHSSALSFFRQQPDFDRFKEDSDYSTLDAETLQNTDVTVCLLARTGTAGRIQAGRLKAFWEDYFSAQGAQIQWCDVEG